MKKSQQGVFLLTQFFHIFCLFFESRSVVFISYQIYFISYTFLGNHQLHLVFQNYFQRSEKLSHFLKFLLFQWLFPSFHFLIHWCFLFSSFFQYLFFSISITFCLYYSLLRSCFLSFLDGIFFSFFLFTDILQSPL